MSGSPAVPVVNLLGTSMSALVHAIPAITSRTGRDVVVIGGLAVVCRLTGAYRATSDLDIVSRTGADERPQLELLLASGAEASGPSGALVPTSVGNVQVDVLEVTDAELADLPDDPTDRLHVLSHACAAVSATPMIIQAGEMPDLTVAVAEPGPLVAMKLQSIMNRPAAKEGTDLLDIIRIVLDPRTGAVARTQLRAAKSQLREVAALHVRRWFIDQAERSARLIRAIPEGRGQDPDDIGLVGELLHSTLNTAVPEG